MAIALPPSFMPLPAAPSSAPIPTPAPPPRWREALWRPRTALALLALWLLATAWLRPLLVPDEGRYGNVAREMLLGVGAAHWRDGRGWVPLLDGLPFFHKPPLMYWLDMAAMAVVGVNPFAARFAPLVGAWLMGASLFLALRRWHGQAAAQRGLLVLATCPFFFVGGQYANLDMLVGGLICATVFAFVRVVDVPMNLRSGERNSRLRWLCAAWALAALAVLAKGLIGIVLPALVVGPCLLAQRRWRDLLLLLHPLGLAVFALLALPWFVAMQLRFPGFFDYFIVEQHFRRFAQASFNNVRPVWFYLLVLPGLTLPWALWLPAALRRLRERSGTLRAGRPPLALYGWWLVVVLGFFSLPSSKLVGYVLPALAPWCALLAFGSAGSGRGFRVTFVASALFSVGAVTVIAVKSPHSTQAAGRALAAQMAPGDKVVFVDEMFYDLPFYAGLREPVIVASDWADPDVPRRDNWRKELFDAARFDPARGAQLLWPIGRLADLGCGPNAVWFAIDPDHDAAALGPVPQLREAYRDATVRLLRAPGRPCASVAAP